jgi:CxxC-x17-CxxC domain-containing protein
VNLPNYKIYLKLMIDGVTSRPFSAKTLPQMVKSGDKKVEEEVIKSSRDLYCRPKEVVEREINDWSGMSLGNDADTYTSSGSMEKFKIICSLCGLEKTVPFKPEPGRPVYCKECMAKIKSGEVKVAKGSENQIKHDESRFYKPLADLGIEFKPKDGNVEETERYPERADHPIPPGKIISAIKKVFTPLPVKSTTTIKPKPVHLVGDNSALKEVLNKVLSEPVLKTVPEPATAFGGVPQEAAISLDSLKEKIKEETSKVSMPAKDRSASAEEMNKLKDFIEEKTEKKDKQKEVPEDVLRKILE